MGTSTGRGSSAQSTRTKLMRASLGAAVCTVPFVLSWNAAGASSVPGTDPPAAPDDSSTGAPVDIEFQVDAALGLIPQDELDEYFRNEQLASEERIRACMEDAGFDYNVNSQSLGAGQTGPETPEEQLAWAEQWGFGVWTTMDPENNPWTGEEDVQYVDVNEFVQDLTPEEQTAWYDAYATCSAEAYGSAEEDPFLNPMVQQAMADFQGWVEADPRTAEAREAWRQCMDDQGQPFADQDEMYQAVWGVDETGELQNQFYASQAWEPDSPDHAQWQELVDREIAIAVADATCTPALVSAIEEVQVDLRPRLIEAWEAVDWDLPPVTVAGEGDLVPVTTVP